MSSSLSLIDSYSYEKLSGIISSYSGYSLFWLIDEQRSAVLLALTASQGLPC